MPSPLPAEQVQELLDAARAYAVAHDRYHAQCSRLAVARGTEHVPANEWDDATLATCTALHDARHALEGISCEIFPQDEQAKAWKDYVAHFFGAKAESRPVDLPAGPPKENP